jgi:DNA-binding response OmpR family regulator
VAGDGEEALRPLEANDYTLGLMDCMMPDVEKYLAAGMDDHLPNPLNLEDLLARIERWLHR